MTPRLETTHAKQSSMTVSAGRDVRLARPRADHVPRNGEGLAWNILIVTMITLCTVPRPRHVP